jgi:hypothetical protein
MRSHHLRADIQELLLPRFQPLDGYTLEDRAYLCLVHPARVRGFGLDDVLWIRIPHHTGRTPVIGVIPIARSLETQWDSIPLKDKLYPEWQELSSSKSHRYFQYGLLRRRLQEQLVSDTPSYDQLLMASAILK